MAMERIAAGGARAEHVCARRTNLKEGARTTTSSAIAGLEGRKGAATETATTAGLTVSFHSGHGEGRTEDCVPESASVVASLMQ
jgi:hypothetical protein